jgi:hypothetical protein
MLLIGFSAWFGIILAQAKIRTRSKWKIPFTNWEVFMKLQKLGGYSAFATLLTGIAMVLYAVLLLNRQTAYMDGPAKAMAAMLAMPNQFYVLLLLIAISNVLGFILVLALHERMQADAPYLTRIMLIAASAGTTMKIAMCLIFFQGIVLLAPMQDLSAFRAFTSVMLGVDLAADLAGALSDVFRGCAILRTQAFSHGIGWLFLLAGIISIPHFIAPILGIISILPSGTAVVWTGIALLRQKQPQPALKEIAVSK